MQTDAEVWPAKNGQQCYMLLKYKYFLSTVQNHTEPHANITQQLARRKLHEVQETDHSTQRDPTSKTESSDELPTQNEFIKLHGSLTL